MRFIAFSTHILAHRNHDDGTASSYFGGQNRAFRSQLELILGGAARARLVVVLLRSWHAAVVRDSRLPPALRGADVPVMHFSLKCHMIFGSSRAADRWRLRQNGLPSRWPRKYQAIRRGCRV